MDHVALLRGINVGTAKRLAMADLRRIALEAGYGAPATVLNSGNLVFEAEHVLTGDDVTALRRAVAAGTGVDADLVVLAAATFDQVAEANPLRRDDRDPARLSVAFTDGADGLDGVAPPAVDLGDDELVVTSGAVYQWLPGGVIASRVPAGWWRDLPVPVTSRNDATVRKIQTLLAGR